MSTFVIKSIDIDLFDPTSIQDAIDQIRKLSTDLKNALWKFCRELAEQGVEVAKVEIEGLGAVDTGGLQESIKQKFDSGSHTAFVYTNQEYALFVEFGTGIVGAEGPMHPAAGEAGWEYDSHGHGHAGWVYPTDERHAMFYAKDGTPLAWTKGMPSRPYMYNTFRKLYDLADWIGGRTVISYIP